ncbi:ABC transporter ATP-binding protein [Nocardioides marmotae]|uniref:sn-glycerol-3-phosphate ABC transporter ATP-binding protein UgpC n=1 Tax=Nocardioides marmotae TaxID=2663857 RepID=A0A6I3J999_9ACTN|nr:sn-glycerol-3-phosphate ABC transporter ATP-binding protein UgpC [Nocardioides marmotae]MCR6030544.1 sn-glycerol-3-phosphate ABC transporter ATP-binding protein UgpC [Gordonia jinghuaiqii]MBC9734928.1 sn-glycerol-3-phosphate ABC transporter ATP-binding protein UgpC [Nocardioides marmotae]MTB86027.1 sn-glycerol-3-phosphate ABC transporter ATP-binding protein UgpC [Nocardioides marmotae]MTB94180.1 sn-glycerol-3-phosphate ABC transporter ATP-binding protein UgpC [Nocardioides marmotae]QKE00469
MAAITMKNIVKKYGDGFPAVNDVSIDVQDGEFMILVGPSGCGKSTLLRMIVGLEDITSGDMIIGDRRVNDLAPRERNLAMVFQNYALYPHLTVYENIAFPLRLAGAPNDEVDRKVREASKTLELDEHLERKPGNLSGGQRQRVAMGRAIVRDADAFLFDEPLSNLDAKLRGQMRTEIARLQKRLGITTVYVTHDQTEAMTLGDRVAVLKRGVLQQLASPRELYTNPANLFVAGFIGSPPMNFLPVTVTGTSAALPFGDVELPQDKVDRVPEGKLLIAGIRPEHFEDAAVVEDSRRGQGSTFTTKVDVVEWLGNEAYAYIPFEAEGAVRDQLTQLERDLDGDTMRSQLVVSLDGSSRIAEGDDAEIWVDVRHMHLFDPETGDNLTIDLDRAGRVPAKEDPEGTAAAEQVAQGAAAH